MSRLKSEHPRVPLPIRCVRLVYGNFRGRIDRGSPWPPLQHPICIRVTGIPAALDRRSGEVEIARIGLALQRLSIDLDEMHGGSAAPAGEFLNSWRIPLLCGQHVDQLTDDPAHAMKLRLSHDVAAGSASEENILYTHKGVRQGLGSRTPHRPYLYREDDRAPPRVLVKNHLDR